MKKLFSVTLLCIFASIAFAALPGIGFCETQYIADVAEIGHWADQGELSDAGVEAAIDQAYDRYRTCKMYENVR